MKPYLRYVVLTVGCTALLCLLAFALVFVSTGGRSAFHDAPTADLILSQTTPTLSDARDEAGALPCIRRIVLDAGHGGEDGGAQSGAGLYEKDINLAVAMQLRDMFEVAGIPVVMTRTEDKLLYDRSVNYQGRKKVLDLAARLTVAKSVPDSLFVSIHMNSFSLPQYSGMQVWYAPAHPASETVASAIQARGLWLDSENTRKIKAAGSNIYLLHRLDTPAVLVEGGFLSNPEEAARLGTSSYQQALAFAIFTSIMEVITAPG